MFLMVHALLQQMLLFYLFVLLIPSSGGRANVSKEWFFCLYLSLAGTSQQIMWLRSYVRVVFHLVHRLCIISCGRCTPCMYAKSIMVDITYSCICTNCLRFLTSEYFESVTSV